MGGIRTHKMVYSNISPKIEKEDIYSENCYVGISMLNNFYWEERSVIFWEWIDKRFDKCVIIIGDYINRHNQKIFFNKGNDDAIIESLKKGDKMIEHLNQFEVLKKTKFIIKRWFDFYSLEETKQNLLNISHIYQNNNEFKQSIEASSTEFINRNIEKLTSKKLEASNTLSLKYIFEELSVFCSLINLGYRVQIYPGKQLQVLKLLAEDKIIADTILSKGIYIDLRTKKY